jgi:hypothetical protein
MNARASIISLSLAAAMLLTGCDALQLGVETPTPAASPTPRATGKPAATVPPASASPAAATRAPATATVPAAASATASAAAPTETPAATAVPPNTPAVSATARPTSVQATAAPGQPQVAESILVLNPGNGSAVTSPVRVTGEADPTFEQNLVIEITDANGAVIATQATTIQSVGAARGPFDTQVPFNVSAEGPGRVSVYSTSARDGGLVHLASAEVTLKTGGPAQPAVSQIHYETHIILEPAPQATISGGSLHISGFSDYVFESQLSLALCGERGSGAPDKVCGTADNVLATGTATLNAPDVGQPGPFAGDLTYHISAKVQARIVVFSRSARDGGILHLSTVPVKLAP